MPSRLNFPKTLSILKHFRRPRQFPEMSDKL
jgi:hypothetical protein